MRMVRCNYFNCLYFFLAVRLLSVQSEQAMNDNNIQIEGNRKPASGSKRGEQRALKHGLTPLKKSVNTLGNRALDKRTMAGKAFNKRKRSIIPAVPQRQILADALSRYMGQLGLARRTKLTSLSEILARDDKPDEGKRHRADEGQ